MSKLTFFVRAMAVLVGAAGIYWFCILPLRCAHAIRATEESTNAASDSMPQWRAVRVARENLRILGSFDQRCCVDMDYDLLLAGNADLLGRKQEAIRHM